MDYFTKIRIEQIKVNISLQNHHRLANPIWYMLILLRKIRFLVLQYVFWLSSGRFYMVF